jgi:serine/threonine protein kinase
MKIRDLIFIKNLGSGAQGEVFLVKDKVTSTPLAVKVLKKSRLDKRHTFFTVEEKQTLCRVKGWKCFLSLEASFNDADNFYLVTVSPLRFHNYNQGQTHVIP